MNIRRKPSYLAIVPALGLAFALSAQAAGDTADRSSATQAQTSSPQQRSAAVNPQSAAESSMAASRLIGMQLTDRNGDDVGEIKDLVVDTTSGEARYAVVAFGGFLGMGEKLFAYPLQRFEPPSANDPDKLVLNVDKERMESAPGFDRSDWPSFNDPAYRAKIDKYYDMKASSADQPRFVRMSEMLDGDVNDRAGDDIGDIHDAAIDLKSGKVHYVVLDFEDDWGKPDHYVAMPMQALRSEDEDGTDLVYQADRDRLANAPSFEKDRWPEIVSDASFSNDFDRFDQSWSTAQADTADVSR
jgi:sporulation protein YlmC with PRC-barrel domain